MFQSIDDLSVDLLRKNCRRLYYFGLGFVQLKLSERLRLHFYSPELPPITEDVHNHRYDFESKILKGVLTNFRYEILMAAKPQQGGCELGDSHILRNESCNTINKAPALSESCALKLLREEHFVAGQSYKMDHTEFHRVEAKNCITLLSRSGYKKEFAQIVTAAGSTPVCAFSKKIEEARLWEIIADMLER